MEAKNKNALIGGLLAIVFVMAVGYAAFSTTLNIQGTANVTSKWDVHIDSITPGTPVGTAKSVSATVEDGSLNANFTTELVSPGDSLTYTVTVKNDGTLAAKLSNLTFTHDENDAILYTYNGIAKDDVIAAGKTQTFTITVQYNPAVTGQPTNTKSDLSMVMNYVQSA